jgi:CRISPR-associated protein Cas8b/Csh1 subtype I-B
MLDLLDSIYTLRNQGQKKIFRKIIYNLKKNYYNQKSLDFLILDTINYLNFLLELNVMENKTLIEKRNLFLKEISNKDLEEYFLLNDKIFRENLENGIEKQGLVILGYFVNKIAYAQKGKSKTFIDKINFDGIKKEKLDKFILQVIEYSEIYKKDIFQEDILFAEMQERLNNLKESSLSKEEVVYYILLGNFLGKYIGIKGGRQKRDENNINEENLNDLEEEENDDTE